MTTISFDALGYFEKLKNAGVPEEQAKVQAEAMRQQAEAQSMAVQKALEKYDETFRRELATKGDVQEVRFEIEKVRAETEKVRGELTEKMEANKHEILKWMMGMMVAQTTLILAALGIGIALIK